MSRRDSGTRWIWYAALLLCALLCGACAEAERTPAPTGLSAESASVSETADPSAAEQPSADAKETIAPISLFLTTPSPLPEETPLPDASEKPTVDETAKPIETAAEPPIETTSAPEPDAAPELPSMPVLTPDPVTGVITVTDEMLDSGMFDPYLNGAVFLGDSITQMFRNYCTELRKTNPDAMGDARFLAGVSLSARHASSDFRKAGGVELKYRGFAVSVSEGLNMMEAKRVFIMLGVNDIVGLYPDETLAYFSKLFDVLEEKCPDVEIVVQGVLPVTQAFCKKRGLTIENWNGFNPRLEALCSERGILYLDFSKLLMDADGYLADEYASDGMFHISKPAYDIWLHELRKFALFQTYPDAVYEPTMEQDTVEQENE